MAVSSGWAHQWCLWMRWDYPGLSSGPSVTTRDTAFRKSRQLLPAGGRKEDRRSKHEKKWMSAAGLRRTGLVGRSWILPTTRVAWEHFPSPEPPVSTKAPDDTLVVAQWTRSRESGHHVGLLPTEQQCCFQPGSEWWLFTTVTENSIQRFSTGMLWGLLATSRDNFVCHTLWGRQWHLVEASGAAKHHTGHRTDPLPNKGMSSPKCHCAEVDWPCTVMHVRCHHWGRVHGDLCTVSATSVWAYNCCKILNF